MTASKTTIDAFTVDQLGDAVGLATNTCPVVWWEDAHAVGCAGCKDKGPKPGFVWALPGMQERCECARQFQRVKDGIDPYAVVCEKCYAEGSHSQGCSMGCRGTGYVVKRDPGALWESLPKRWAVSAETGDGSDTTVVSILGPGRDSQGRYRDYVSSGATLEQTLLRAVAQALVAQGAMLGGSHEPATD